MADPMKPDLMAICYDLQIRYSRTKDALGFILQDLGKAEKLQGDTAVDLAEAVRALKSIADLASTDPLRSATEIAEQSLNTLKGRRV